MDFGSVLYTAQRNDEYGRQSNGWYKTGFAPPKKEQREKKLSLNIQKFLAKKEAEEKQKKLEAERKKQDLLALRSQDKKTVKRVQSMIKRTKSANKSVIEDAIDHDNTAVTAAGTLQPDEDDYGYVSKDAEALYNQLIHKYNTMPSEDLFKKSSNKTAKDISTTKDRVKAALQREEDEKLLPRKRKRKSKESDPDHVSEAEDSDDDRPEKINEQPKPPEKFKIPKKNALAPPPLDFQALLKLAEKKQHEPIIIEKPIEEKPERPMTQKEKQEYMRERERKQRREMKVTNSESHNHKIKESINKQSKSVVDKPSSSSSVATKSEIKLSQKDRSSSTHKPSRSASTSNQGEKTLPDPKKQPPAKVVRIDEKPKLQTDRLKQSQKPAPGDKFKASTENGRLCDRPKLPMSAEIDKKRAMMMKKAREQYYAEQRKNPPPTKSSVEREDQNRMKAVKRPLGDTPKIPADRKKIPASSLSSPAKKIPSREGVREFPPRDMIKQFPPPDMIRKKKPPPKPVRRRVIESDDEYDSEMDDFIDDTEDPNDVSKYISEIFNYDRSRYARMDEEEDDDEECMVSNFADLEKEEYNSLVTAVKEDLEDVRRTKLEKARKKKRMLSRS